MLESRLPFGPLSARSIHDERDAAIHAWAESVWRAFSMNRPTLVTLLAEFGY